MLLQSHKRVPNWEGTRPFLPDFQFRSDLKFCNRTQPKLIICYAKSVIYIMSSDVIREATITVIKLDGVKVH